MNTTTTTTGPTYRLGRLPTRLDRRTLRLGHYLTGALPNPPAQGNWLTRVPSWPMYGNDRIGDCTIAAAGHQIQAWTAYANTEITLADDAITAAYSAITGYTPTDPDTDQGAVELDVLNFWRRRGIGGHHITAYAALNVADEQQVRAAITLFGGIYIGLALPLSARTQIGKTWRPVSGEQGRPGSWGGHAVHVGGYDRAGLTCVTWGARQRMSWTFWAAYVEEAYALVANPDWFSAAGLTPKGLNLPALLDDLHKITA